VLEQRDRGYAEARVRAGVLEHGAAELLRAAGVGGRMDREALVHRGIYLNFDGSRHHIDFHALVGRTILVYGQQEVVIDLIQARLDAGGDIRFEAEAIGIDAAMPAVRYVSEGQERVLEAELVAACDGSHGVGRAALERSTVYDHEFEHAWLGVLARTPPASDELIYAYHDHGFALHSMRSPEISRLYLQVAPDEQLESWPEERIWAELRIRLGEPNLRAGEILELGVTPMRSVVVEPMQGGRLFLAGDAAHIVPSTGAKGIEPRPRRRRRAGQSDCRMVPDECGRRAEGLLRRVRAARVARATVQLVHDQPAPQGPRRRPLPAPPPPRQPRPHRELYRRLCLPGGELRRRGYRRRRAGSRSARVSVTPRRPAPTRLGSRSGWAHPAGRSPSPAPGNSPKSGPTGSWARSATRHGVGDVSER